MPWLWGTIAWAWNCLNILFVGIIAFVSLERKIYNGPFDLKNVVRISIYWFGILKGLNYLQLNGNTFLYVHQNLPFIYILHSNCQRLAINQRMKIFLQELTAHRSFRESDTPSERSMIYNWRSDGFCECYAYTFIILVQVRRRDEKSQVSKAWYSRFYF